MDTVGLNAPGGRSRRPGGDQIIPRPPRWAPGAPAPWDGRASAPVSLDAVLGAVAARGPGRPLDQGKVPARTSAVLIGLHDGPHGAEVLLTKRSWELRHHRGEISFPGGRLDPGETPVDAALREAHEEVGLDPALVEVHGGLDHVATAVSDSYIVPVVARLDRRPDLVAATVEVQRVLWVPLVELLRPDTYRQELWWRDQGAWAIHFFELDDETIWGATGRMLVQLLCVSLGLQTPAWTEAVDTARSGSGPDGAPPPP